jgi:hypothetical protein
MNICTKFGSRTNDMDDNLGCFNLSGKLQFILYASGTRHNSKPAPAGSLSSALDKAHY